MTYVSVSDVAGLIDAGALSPLSCQHCHRFHKGIRSGFCEVEIASHEPAIDIEPPSRDVVPQPCLSPTYEEAVEELAERGIVVDALGRY